MFSNHLTIYERVSAFDPTITEDMVLSWALDLETMHIADTNVMAQYEGVPLTVNETTQMALLPCNIYRILHVHGKSDIRVPYSLVGSKNGYIKILDDSTEVYITYLGIPFDENGYPQILNSHIPAHETWVKLKIKEIPHLNGKYDPNMYAMFERQLANQLTAISQSAVAKDVDSYNKSNVIRYNMISQLGQERLLHKWFK